MSTFGANALQDQLSPFLPTPVNGYWFSNENIKVIEHKYGARYMGYWAKKTSNGNWTEQPVDVFYQPNPKTELGHTHYFGMFRHDGETMITAADSCFKDPITGVLGYNGEVFVSRYRHDSNGGADGFIDGGRDYLRLGGAFCKAPLVYITVKDDHFEYEVKQKEFA